MTDTHIHYIIISKFNDMKKADLIILFIIDKDLEIGLHNLIIDKK